MKLRPPIYTSLAYVPLVYALAYATPSAQATTPSKPSTAISKATSTATTASQTNNKQGYLRFPAIAGEQLVFTAEGDLWRASSQGGQAHRLTTHPSEETNAALSPDGKMLAFTAAYDGVNEVYLMPIEGGVAQRLSFENTGSTVLGWSAQGEVLYRVQAEVGPNLQNVLKLVNPANLQRRTLPVFDATDASLDASGKHLYFTRMGHQLHADNVRRYRGGTQAQIWHYALDGQQEAQRVSPQQRFNDSAPMWWQGRLYFISDRDGSDNLWSMASDGSDARQLSHERAWDVRNPQLADGRIVYQLGADVHVLDLASKQSKALSISLQSDFEQQRERLLAKPLKYVQSSHFAPAGDKIALSVRGKIILAGAPPMRQIHLPLPANSRAKEALLSPDGKTVYAICDATGEQEIWRFAADGSDAGQALTHDGNSQRMRLELSPDGKKLAHFNKQGQLFFLDLTSGKNVLIESGIGRDYEDLKWSPDSSLLAIVRPGEQTQRSQIWLYDLAKSKLHMLTSDKYQSAAPVFSTDGKWLYLLSERHYDAVHGAPWGDRHMGPFFDKRSKIYAYALQADTHFPFQATTELDAAADKPSKTEDKAAAKVSKISAPTWAGLAQRVYELPLPNGNYRDLASDGKFLYWLEFDASKPESGVLKTLAIDNKGTPPDVFASDISQFALSQDGKKIYLQKFSEEGFGEVLISNAGAKAAPDLAKSSIPLKGLQLLINPQQEWQQMFDDAWRMQRDYLFDAGMRGLDWPAMRQKYAPLLARVHDKYELNDLLGLMMAELGTLHSQIAKGDVRNAELVSKPAFLGAVLEKQAHGYKVSHIYRGETELPSTLSPLAQTGMAIAEGDLITAINGRDVRSVPDISDLLRNQAGQQVLLTYIKSAQSKPQQLIVTPVDGKKNAALRYTDWETARQQQVAKLGQGKIGYLHLRAMTGGDLNTFAREFYSNIERDGLIIDVRRNGGGNIDSWIIEKLMRRAWAFWQPRNGKPETNMQQTFRGHLVVLADELTYSDGETFVAGVKALQLGPVIGKRTSGAGVWLSDNNSLLDNGRARVAEYAQHSVADGAWLVEGTGVAPDIEVDNLPHASFNGQDAQLDAAIKLLQEKIQKQPVPPLKAQPLPVRNPD